MTILKDLTFVEGPEASKMMTRRRDVIVRLEQQKKLAQDPNYTRTINTKDGEKTKKVRPNWKMTPAGEYAFVVKQIEFAPGKRAVLVKSLDELPSMIDKLINAVRSGELDSKLMTPAKKLTPTVSKRRAA